MYLSVVMQLHVLLSLACFDIQEVDLKNYIFYMHVMHEQPVMA